MNFLKCNAANKAGDPLKCWRQYHIHSEIARAHPDYCGQFFIEIQDCLHYTTFPEKKVLIKSKILYANVCRAGQSIIFPESFKTIQINWTESDLLDQKCIAIDHRRILTLQVFKIYRLFLSKQPAFRYVSNPLNKGSANRNHFFLFNHSESVIQNSNTMHS